MNKLKALFSSKIFSNFFSLSLLQLTNYLLPVILIPYLIRTVGIEKFGLLAIAQAISNYLVILTDYGFNLIATRDISVNIHQKSKIQEIYNAVLSSKIILTLVAFIILLVLIVFFYQNEYKLFLSVFLVVIGHTFLPSWFFQGYQDMKYMTIANLISKIVSTCLIFIFIKSSIDYQIVNVFYGIGGITSAMACFVIIYFKYNLSFRFSKWIHIKNYLINGFYMFLSNFSINVYMNSSILIANLFCTSTEVGYYSVAEKIFMIIRQLLSVFSQIIYPKVCLLAESNFKGLLTFLKQSMYFAILPITIGSLGMFVFAKEIVFLITDSHAIEIISIVKVFSFCPIIILLNVPFYQVLLAYDHKKTYSLVLISGSIVHILLNFILTYHFSYMGTSISVLLTEIYITFGLMLSLHVYHPAHSILNLFNGNLRR